MEPEGITVGPLPIEMPILADLRDVNERLLIAALREQALAEALDTERVRLARILDTIGDAVLMIDGAGHTLLTNPAYLRLLGDPADPFAMEDVHGQVLPIEETPHSRAARGESFSLEFTVRSADGALRWCEAHGQPIGSPGRHAGGVIVVRDITKHKELADALQHQALHDALTGLPNRLLLQDRLSLAARTARRTAAPLAMLLLDLDNFKVINDNYGHQAGDVVLQEVARRLTRTVRDVDTVCRWGGDEFALLLPTTTAAGAVAVAEKLRGALGVQIEIDGYPVHVSMSMGIAMNDTADLNGETMLRKADIAMYEAKRLRMGIARYSVGDDRSYQLGLASELGQAIKSGQLVLQYQPQVRPALYPGASNACIYGVEALVRWNHPDGGLILPDEFIPLAERTGLIVPLTAKVLDLALQQARLWRLAGRSLVVAVNLSIANLSDREFPQPRAHLLQRYDVPASSLRLELTESMVLVDLPSILVVLSHLVALGVALSIDDFGKAYASMTYLKELPVKEIKIDRSFLVQASRSESDAALVRALVTLGHGLGMQIVAEGVEDAPTWEFVKEVGCDAVQGEYVSQPLAVDSLDAWLTQSAS